MSLVRAVSKGLRALFRKSAAERELDDEVVQYIEASAADKVRLGMSRDEAMRAARIEFGGIEPVKEQVRTARWESAVESVFKDIRYAIRSLLRNPGYSAIGILTLALGIGVNTGMFSIVNAVVLRPLPYPAANRLVMIWTDDGRRGLHREATAYSTILDWRHDGRSFEGLAYFSTQRVAPFGNDPSSPRERSRSAFASGNLFDVLGVPPAQGRTLTTDDESRREPVVVISDSFRQRHFNGAADVIGKTVVMDDASRGGPASFTVVGVMPPGFYFPDKLTELWIPSTTYWRFQRESTERFPDWARRWTAVARVKAGVSIPGAAADLARIGERLSSTYASTAPDFPGFATSVVPMLDVVAGRDTQYGLWLLLGAVGLVLLAACANVANLMLARGAARQREFAVRRALGAGRGRLIRQLACESLVLSLAGGAAGFALAVWSARAFALVAGSLLPRMDEFAVDSRVLGFALGVSLVAGLLFGIVPAFRLSTTDANRALREGSRGTQGRGVRRHHNALVLVECALAVVLLSGAGLLLRSLMAVQSIDPGFDSRRVLTMRLEFPAEAPPTAEERTQTSQIAPARARGRNQSLQTLFDRISGIPGVESVGLTDDLFINGQPNDSITIPGRDVGTFATGELNQAAAAPGFFETLRVPLVRGRLPTRDDADQKIRALWSPVITDMPLDEKERRAIAEPVVVNDAFARRFFTGEDPIGKRFCIDPTNKTYWYVIVGVVGDMHRQGLEHEVIPEYYGPYLPSPNGRADLLVRTTGDPLALSAAVRRAVVETMPGVVIPSTTTADAQFGAFTAGRRMQTWLLVAFAGLGVILAAVGIFGLVHYAVAERTREMGVRIAMGASSSDVVRLVVRQGMQMPLAGIALGLAAAALLTRVMASLLFKISAFDPLTFAFVGILLSTMAMLACYLPARRASRIDPMVALRQD